MVPKAYLKTSEIGSSVATFGRRIFKSMLTVGAMSVMWILLTELLHVGIHGPGSSRGLVSQIIQHFKNKQPAISRIGMDGLPLVE